MLKCFFPVENSHFGRPKTNFSGFEKWKVKNKKKKKKKIPPHFVNSPFHFQFSTFPFSTFPFLIFLLFFSIFLFLASLFIPGRSAEISRWEMSGALCPPAVMPLLTLPLSCYSYIASCSFTCSILSSESFLIILSMVCTQYLTHPPTLGFSSFTFKLFTCLESCSFYYSILSSKFHLVALCLYLTVIY